MSLCHKHPNPVPMERDRDNTWYCRVCDLLASQESSKDCSICYIQRPRQFLNLYHHIPWTCPGCGKKWRTKTEWEKVE